MAFEEQASSAQNAAFAKKFHRARNETAKRTFTTDWRLLGRRDAWCRLREGGADVRLAGAKRSNMKFSNMAAAGGRKKPHQADPLGPNSEIGRKLKQYYDGLISDDVPDKFADLLRQLEEREAPATARDGE